MHCEKLDLTTLVDLVYYELRHCGQNATSNASVDPGITACWADVRLMMTVLRNLLGNAWKYTWGGPQSRPFASTPSSATAAPGTA